MNNEFFKSRLVVVAQVLSEKTELDADGFPVLSDYQVKVLNTYRGSRRPILIIRSENDSGRFPMQKGEKFLLFVRVVESHFVIDNCGNSGPLSEAGDTIDAIKEISKAGPYGEIEAHVRNGEDDVAGIHFIARSSTRSFSAISGDDGWIHLRVPSGAYKLTSDSKRFRLELFDLNEDRPNNLIVHNGGSVQLDYDANPE
ncbi:MAG: hypothetical protein WB543_15285 [Candidatus Acidiferrum sp.]